MIRGQMDKYDNNKATEMRFNCCSHGNSFCKTNQVLTLINDKVELRERQIQFLLITLNSVRNESCKSGLFDVYGWLSTFNMQRYADVFLSFEIGDIAVIKGMSVKDLIAIGIKDSSHCKLIRREAEYIDLDRSVFVIDDKMYEEYKSDFLLKSITDVPDHVEDELIPLLAGTKKLMKSSSSSKSHFLKDENEIVKKNLFDLDKDLDFIESLLDNNGTKSSSNDSSDYETFNLEKNDFLASSFGISKPGTFGSFSTFGNLDALVNSTESSDSSDDYDITSVARSKDFQGILDDIVGIENLAAQENKKSQSKILFERALQAESSSSASSVKLTFPKADELINKSNDLSGSSVKINTIENRAKSIVEMELSNSSSSLDQNNENNLKMGNKNGLTRDKEGTNKHPTISDISEDRDISAMFDDRDLDSSNTTEKSSKISVIGNTIKNSEMTTEYGSEDVSISNSYIGDVDEFNMDSLSGSRSFKIQQQKGDSTIFELDLKNDSLNYQGRIFNLFFENAAIQAYVILDDVTQEESSDFSNEREVVETNFLRLIPYLPDSIRDSLVFFYRSFIDPIDFLRQLYDAYHSPTPTGRPDYDEQKVKLARYKLIKMLTEWISNYIEDFLDSNVQDLFNYMMDNLVEPTAPNLVNSTRSRLETEIERYHCLIEGTDVTFSDDPPTPIAPKSKNFLDFSPLEIARQLTLHESALFRKIHPMEFLGAPWLKSPKNSPNIIKLMEWHLDISSWVSLVVLLQKKPGRRAKTMKFFVSIMHELNQIQNYNTLSEIMQGLANKPVTRLSSTWQSFQKKFSKANEEYIEMKDLISSSNHGLYSKSNPPCLPLLSRYLDRIKNIELELENCNDLYNLKVINLTKMLKLSEIVSEMRYLSKQCFNFTMEPTVSSYMVKIVRVDDSLLMQKSLEVEGSTKKKKGKK